MDDTSKTDENKEKDDTAPPKTVPKSGFFSRLFGTALTGDEITIGVAPFIDAAGQDHARELAAVFHGLSGIRVKPFREKPILTPDTDRSELLPSACAQAMGWISLMNLDLVLWGDIPPPGTTFFIHFAAAPPQDKDPAGIVSPFQALNLPVNFDPQELGGLLASASLAALNLSDPKKLKNCRNLVASTLERAAQDIERIPGDFTVREQASVQAAFANALASFGHLFPGGEVYHRSAEAYSQALQGTMRAENPVNWAYLQRNLGAVLQAFSERTDDMKVMQKAADAFRAALEIFTQDTTPFPWATTQTRLGEILYRMDIKSGETQGLKESLTLFQSALKVLSLKSTPLLWSDTMNNLGQAAQILGRELGNVDVIERSITACSQALKARNIKDYPTLWAATQNNMGSALFLLGRMKGEEEYYQKALNSFMGAREVYDSMGLTKMVKLTEKNIQHAEARLPEKTKNKASHDPAMWWLEEGEGEDESKPE